MNAAAGLWDAEEIAAALSTRDIAAVYRYLQRHGLSQRRIAALTGQAQPEIVSVLAGRKVTSYNLLVRIAEGLAIPRGRLGLAYDTPDGRPDSDRVAATTNAHESGPGPASLHRPTAVAVTATCQHQAWLAQPWPTRRPVPEAVYSIAGATAVPAIWTGAHSTALRRAMRLSVREFARQLGMSPRMVSKWAAGGLDICPRPFAQESLDMCLLRTDEEIRLRFFAILTLYGIGTNGGGEFASGEPVAADAADQGSVETGV